MTDSLLFTHEDRDLLHGVAEGIYGQVTTSSKVLGDQVWDLAGRIQQWLDQQGTPLQLGQMSVTWSDGHGSIVAGPQIVNMIDETDLTEEG